MKSAKSMNIYISVGVTAFPITYTSKNDNANETISTKFLQMSFLTNIVFLYKNVKLSRCRYSVLKRLVKLTRFKSFPLQLSGHQDIPPLSFVLRHQLEYVGWVSMVVKYLIS